MSGVYKIPGGQSPLERPRRKWEDNMKMDVKEME
jgi:hypothetical protein